MKIKKWYPQILVMVIIASSLWLAACGNGPSPSPTPTHTPRLIATHTPTSIPPVENFLPACDVTVPKGGVLDNNAVIVQWGEVSFYDHKFSNNKTVDVSGHQLNLKVSGDRMQVKLEMQTAYSGSSLFCGVISMQWRGQIAMPVASQDFTKSIDPISSAPVTKGVISASINLEDPFIKPRSDQTAIPVPFGTEITLTFRVRTMDKKVTSTTQGNKFTFIRQ